MDLLMITRKIWRHRIVTLPVIVLTFLGMVYVVAIKSSEYWATSSYVLINPPAPPTAEEMASVRLEVRGVARRPAVEHIEQRVGAQGIDAGGRG